jgi:proteasome alpha subunit
MKPLEVEVIVAEVGDDRLAGHEKNELYAVTFDGFISDRHGYCVIGGHVDDVQSMLRSDFREGMPLGDSLGLGRKALSRGANGSGEIPPENLEVCVLERSREGRKFRRLPADEVKGMLEA